MEEIEIYSKFKLPVPNSTSILLLQQDGRSFLIWIRCIWHRSHLRRSSLLDGYGVLLRRLNSFFSLYSLNYWFAQGKGHYNSNSIEGEGERRSKSRLMVRYKKILASCPTMTWLKIDLIFWDVFKGWSENHSTAPNLFSMNIAATMFPQKECILTLEGSL